MRRDASCEETLHERNRFVCIFVLEITRTTINAAFMGNLERLCELSDTFYKWEFCTLCVLCF